MRESYDIQWHSLAAISTASTCPFNISPQSPLHLTVLLIIALVRKAIIFSNPGWLWAMATQVIRSNQHNLQHDISIILANERYTRSAGNTRRSVQYFEQIARDCQWLSIFIGKNIHVIIICCQWHQFDILLSGDRRQWQMWCCVAWNHQELLRKIDDVTTP